MRVMRNRILGWAVGLALLGGVSLWAAYFAPDRRPATIDLNYTLKDMNGRDVRLADFRGKPLIVNFWATWCGPCLLETPELVELASEYRDQGLVVIGISTDDTPEEIRKYAANLNVTYPLLVGSEREDVFTAFGLGAGIPMSVFVRPDGTVANRLQGINTKQWFQTQIDGILPASK